MPKILRSMKEEPPRKTYHLLVRIPTNLAKRMKHQSDKLTCSLNLFARMAFIKFCEEEEAKERTDPISYPR